MAPPRRKSPKITGSVKPFVCNLTYDTAASLEHLINAQSVHAEEMKRQGFDSLFESVEQLKPFWNALNSYLTNPPR